jgi:predicted double-glycine peptidase
MKGVNMNIMMTLRNEKKFTISAIAGKNVLVATPDLMLDCDYKLGDFVKGIPRLKGEVSSQWSQEGNHIFRR